GIAYPPPVAGTRRRRRSRRLPRVRRAGAAPPPAGPTRPRRLGRWPPRPPHAASRPPRASPLALLDTGRRRRGVPPRSRAGRRRAIRRRILGAARPIRDGCSRLSCWSWHSLLWRRDLGSSARMYVAQRAPGVADAALDGAEGDIQDSGGLP